MKSIQSPTRSIIVIGFLLLTAITITISPLYEATAAPSPTGSHIIYVNQAAGGNNDGTNWTNAFTDLQDALTAAGAGDAIWVAAGLYKPANDPTDRDATFQLKDGVALYGGFAGTETGWEEREWSTNLTVLSGDIDNNDVTDANGVVTDTVNIVGANSYHVVTGNGTDATAVLDGFVITAGQADGLSFPHTYGGGLLNQSGSPTLSNLVFTGNWAYWGGGGMYNRTGSNPILTGVLFNSNSNSTNSGNTAGGGMHNSNGSNPTLINVVFTGNWADFGGGMYNVNSDPTLTSVTFNDNRANYGGGTFNNNSHPTLTNVTFSANNAITGGGVYNWESNPSLINITFSGNNASAFGGGMRNNPGSAPILTNVTFSGNNAGFGGGMANGGDSHPILQNSIFWYNQDNSGVGTAAASIFNDTDSLATIRYSLAQGCNPGGKWEDACGIDAGNNLADADPLFIETPDPAGAPTTAGNLRLQDGSPAIDTGNDTYVMGVLTDLDGKPRISDTAVDLGPYESGAYAVTVNIVGQGTIIRDPDNDWYSSGTVLTVTAVADPGWTFSHWSGDLSGSTNPETLTIEGDKTLTATFTSNVYYLFLPLILNQ